MTDSWQNLTKLSENIPDLYSLFENDADRGQRLSLQAGDIYCDYSKNLITDQVMNLLFTLARERQVEDKRNAMFAGEHINKTEDRAVLHTALRNTTSNPVFLDGTDIMPKIRSVLKRMGELSDSVRQGTKLGYTGKQFRHIVNIGIGGSDLGPAMAYEALQFYRDRSIQIHFVSNIDGTHIAETLSDKDPEETLFIIASKTFTTDETMTNADTAKKWLTEKLGPDAIKEHFIALSTADSLVENFGISKANIFEFWDWVGGRYSLPSAIGLSLMIAIGKDNFGDLLDGYNKVDQHFVSSPLESNLPVILALIGIWNTNFLGATTEAILPYDQYLNKFPEYMQQANMESNGKSFTLSDKKTDYSTGPVIWGASGTNGQHAFYQLIHQGTHYIPCDFIMFKESLNHPGGSNLHHEKLNANCLAQSRALAFGSNINDGNTESGHKYFAGNRSSNTLLLPKLTPNILGQLISLYEHKIFVQGIIWDINSFDQMGVELGKTVAKSIYNRIAGIGNDKFDSSTEAILEKLSS